MRKFSFSQFRISQNFPRISQNAKSKFGQNFRNFAKHEIKNFAKISGKRYDFLLDFQKIYLNGFL